MKGCRPKLALKKTLKLDNSEMAFHGTFLIALFAATFSHLHYIVFEQGCKVTSG